MTTMCGITGLPIIEGEDVVFLILDKDGSNSLTVEPEDHWTPITFPMFAKYGGHGTVTEVVKNTYTEILETVFGEKLETVLATIRDKMFYRDGVEDTTYELPLTANTHRMFQKFTKYPNLWIAHRAAFEEFGIYHHAAEMGTALQSWKDNLRDPVLQWYATPKEERVGRMRFSHSYYEIFGDEPEWVTDIYRTGLDHTMWYVGNIIRHEDSAEESIQALLDHMLLLFRMRVALRVWQKRYEPIHLDGHYHFKRDSMYQKRINYTQRWLDQKVEDNAEYYEY